MRVVEVGAGWGWMSCYLAKHYDVHVTNYGLVDAQNERMRQMIHDWGVEDRVTLVQKDHRDLLDEPEQYDRYVSIGVLEHAGRCCQEAWVESIQTCLKEGGVGFISALGHARENVNSSFINRLIWPGTDLIPLPKMIRWLDHQRLHVLDIENVWYHYQRAVEDWGRNFVENKERIQAIDHKRYDEAFFRAWRIYLEGCPVMFEENHWNAHCWHITFTKGKHKDYYPLTRDFLYHEFDSPSRLCNLEIEPCVRQKAPQTDEGTDKDS